MPDSSLPIKTFCRVDASAAQRWALAIVAIAYWGNSARSAARQGVGGLAIVIDAVLQNGAFCAAAWALIGTIAVRHPPAAPNRLSNVALLSLACLIAAVPASQATMFAMVILAVHFFRLSEPGRALALLLTGLAANTLWTSPYVIPLHATVGRVDAALVRGLAGAGGNGNLVSTSAKGFDLEILGQCASSFPLAAVALAYAVMRLLDGQLPGQRDAPGLLLSWLVSIGLTEGRLTLMACNPAKYSWLHDGNGATIYGVLATTGAFLVPALVGSAPGSRPRRL